MPVSRLRLRLALRFGATFFLGLLLLDVGFWAWTRSRADARLTRSLRAAAAGILVQIGRERADAPDLPVDSAAGEVLGEWPPGPIAIAVLDSSGRRLRTRGGVREIAALPQGPFTTPTGAAPDRPLDQEGHLRAAWAGDPADAGITVVTGQSTAGLREQEEELALALLVSLPVIVLGAGSAGYILARRALEPVAAMAHAIGAMDAERLDRRLPVRQPPDELDQVAIHFNGLVDRLATAQATNRRFLAAAAHQLRTPLTIVRGESALGLDRPRSVEEYQQTMRRVSLAAEQMSRRVGELFLLAEAEAGERPALTERVEVDGVLFEAADLMRGRASALGRALEFGRVDAATLTGTEHLLREAMIELLENACRHGAGRVPIRLEALREGNRVEVRISSDGPLLTEPEGEASGLGLSIVRWVAAAHGGSFRFESSDGGNVAVLDLPVDPEEAA